MLKHVIKKIVGSRHGRQVRKLLPLVREINAHYEGLASLSDEELKAKTEEFRARIRARLSESQEKIEALRQKKRGTREAGIREELSGELRKFEERFGAELKEALDELMCEAFAVVKEACRRMVGRTIQVTGQLLDWDMIPYDVQLIGAIQLHQGKVAEMATGEGKTLVATMPLYLNALSGRGAHLVTVNSYLAQRDSEWMGAIFEQLGISVGCIDLHAPGSPERREAYLADIAYGTNNEFGFDYLRDNMVHALEQRVQRSHYYAIIDEVDSILIDEARTPLIISGPVSHDTATPFRKMKPAVESLFRKQSKMINRMVAEAAKALEGDDEDAKYEAGEKLLAAKRGGPKNRRLMKMFADDPSLLKLAERVEADYMREKRLHEIDERLLFAMDEKGSNVHLSDEGLDSLSPNDPEAFVVPDLSLIVGEIEDNEDLSVEDKRTRIEELERDYAAKSQKIHVIHQLLKAYTLFHRDERYIIGEDNSVVIVDEFTGRQMPGRRWSDGLHQAVEAKEGVSVRGETQTLATVTIQNYFRMYDKLAGMTGTAETEETEFHQIYNLDVSVIPTNRPIARDDREDLIFRTRREKYSAIMDEVERLNRLELPVLVGTTNVDVSETLSRMLRRRRIRHKVLNAKHHQSESEIIAEAGQAGSVTIATNMAGRGTDIKLGEGVTEPRTVAWAKEKGLELETVISPDPNRYENPEKLADKDDYLIEAGGLHILGSERHEARRIDRQLRGRAGRQGDPGASQFYLSLEDDLMRLFGGMERIAGVMDSMGAKEGEVITHPLVTRSIGRAQKRVEGNNFEARKRLLDYDDVMNQQREVIYDLRLFALEGGEDLRGEIMEIVRHALQSVIDSQLPTEASDELDLSGLRSKMLLDLHTVLPRIQGEEDGELTRREAAQAAESAVEATLQQQMETFGDYRDRVSSFVLLSTIDLKWKDHLYDLDGLKASIGFRGWGQKDPLVEYKKEAYEMFVGLMDDLRSTVTRQLFRVRLQVTPDAQAGASSLATSGTRTVGSGGGTPIPSAGLSSPRKALGGLEKVSASKATPGGIARANPAAMATNRRSRRRTSPVRSTKTPGRNSPCPCGSGLKYKKCCLRKQSSAS